MWQYAVKLSLTSFLFEGHFFDLKLYGILNEKLHKTGL